MSLPSQSLALGLAKTAASQLVKYKGLIVFAASQLVE